MYGFGGLMPGPIPKSADVRQRRNAPRSRALLPAEADPRLAPPRLPKHPVEGEKWHGMARAWWRDVWASPMQAEFLEGDVPALVRLVMLVDTFWKSQSLAVAKEIRLMEREFGLTPLSRRRLEWNVAQAEDAKDKHELKRSKRAIVISGDDPRDAL